MNFPILSAIDIDGTLVNPAKVISEGNKAGIAAYVKAGGTVTLASGRMHSSMLPYALQLNLPPDNIILSYNGAMAKTVGGELLFERPLPLSVGADLVEYCRDNKMHLNFYYDDVLYVSELNACSELYERRSGSPSVPVGDLSKMTVHAPTKLIIIDQKEKLDSLLPWFREKYHHLNITKTDDEYLEFMAEGVDKGSGLEWVCEKLKIPQSLSAAFGDSYNDVQMIEWARIGVAMNNGRDAAVSAADVVALNEDWAGVGDTLISFINLR